MEKERGKYGRIEKFRREKRGKKTTFFKAWVSEHAMEFL